MAERQHVVLIHRYFHPDTPPYAAILREIALGLGRAGHRVTVLTCQPSYNRSVVDRAPARERLAPSVEVRRWPVLDDRTSTWKKLANLVWFCARLATARLGPADRVMAASTPPLAVAIVAAWRARRAGAEFVYHHQDIYPEVSEGMGGGPGRLARVLRAVDSRTDRQADRVVVLSDDMARLMAGRGVAADRISVLNNFDPWRLSPERADLVPADRLRVVYAGNLGRFQSLDVVFDALTALRDDDRFEFTFLGEGPLRPRLEQLVESEGLARVSVRGYVPPEQLAELLQSQADVGLVTLNRGVIRAAYPSKTMSYLRNGVPVLALVESGTALVAQLEAYAAGWGADPTRPGSLVATLIRLASAREAVAAAREPARRLYRDEFDQDVAIPRWEELLGQPSTRSVTKGSA